MNKKSFKFKTLLGSAVSLLGVTTVVAPLATLTSCSKTNRSNFLGSDIDREFDVNEATIVALTRSFRDQYEIKLRSDWVEKPQTIKKKLDAFDRVMSGMVTQCNNKSYSVVSSTIVKFARDAYGINLISNTKVQPSDITRLWDGMKSSMIASMHNSQSSPKDIDLAMKYAEEQKTAIMSEVYAKYGNNADPLTVYIEAKTKLGACFAKVNKNIAKMAATSRLKDFFDKYTVSLKSDNEIDSFKAPRLDDLEMNNGGLHQKIDDKGIVHIFAPYIEDENGNVLSDGDMSLWANDIFEFTNNLTGEKEPFDSKNMLAGYLVKPVLKEISHSGISNVHTIKVDWQAINTNLAPEVSKATIGHFYKDNDVQDKLNNTEGKEEAPSLDEVFTDSNIETIDYDMPVSEYGEGRTDSWSNGYSVNHPAPGSEAWWLKKTYFTTIEERIEDKEVNKTLYQGILPEEEFDQRANIAFKWDEPSRLSYESLFASNSMDVSTLKEDIHLKDGEETIDGTQARFLAYTDALADAGLLITEDELTEDGDEDTRNFYPLSEAVTGLQYEQQDSDGRVIPTDVEHLTPESSKIENFVGNCLLIGVVETKRQKGANLRIRLTPVYGNSPYAERTYEHWEDFNKNVQNVDDSSQWFDTTFKDGEFPLSSKAYYHINETYNEWLDLFSKYEGDGEYDKKMDEITVVILTYLATSLLATLLTAWTFTQVVDHSMAPWVAVTYEIINILSIVSLGLLCANINQYRANRFVPALHFDNRVEDARQDKRYTDMYEWLHGLKEKLGTIRWNINYEVSEDDYLKGFTETYLSADYWQDIAPQIQLMTGVGGEIEDIQKNFLELLQEKNIAPAVWEKMSNKWLPGGSEYKKADKLDKIALGIDLSCMAVGLMLPFVDALIFAEISNATTLEKRIAQTLAKDEPQPKAISPGAKDSPSLENTGFIEGHSEQIVTPDEPRIDVGNLSPAAREEIKQEEEIIEDIVKTGEVPETKIDNLLSKDPEKLPIMSMKERKQTFDKVMSYFAEGPEESSFVRKVSVELPDGSTVSQIRYINSDFAKCKPLRRLRTPGKRNFKTWEYRVPYKITKEGRPLYQSYSTQIEQFYDGRYVPQVLSDPAREESQSLFKNYWYVKYQKPEAKAISREITYNLKYNGIAKRYKMIQGLKKLSNVKQSILKRNTKDSFNEIYNAAYAQSVIERGAVASGDTSQILAIKEPWYKSYGISAKGRKTMNLVTSNNVDLRTAINEHIEDVLVTSPITQPLKDPRAKYVLFRNSGGNPESIFGTWSEQLPAGSGSYPYSVTKFDPTSALEPQRLSFKGWARTKMQPYCDAAGIDFDEVFTRAMIYDSNGNLTQEFKQMRSYFLANTGQVDHFDRFVPKYIKDEIREISTTVGGQIVYPYKNTTTFIDFIENMDKELAKNPEMFDAFVQAYFQHAPNFGGKGTTLWDAGYWARTGLDRVVSLVSKNMTEEGLNVLRIVKGYR